MKTNESHLDQKLLTSLAGAPPKMTAMNVVSSHLEAIKAAKKNGWSTVSIHDAFVKSGYKLSLQTFRQYLSKAMTASKRASATQH